MPTLFLNGVPVSVPAGLRLSDALPPADAIPLPCAGLGRCGKCRVVATGALSPVSEAEKAALTREDLANHVRLACCTFLLGDACVTTEKAASAHILLGTEPETPAPPRPSSSPGYTRLGAAIDLGTTTLAARLYDETGRLLTQGGCPNPQSHFGADVIARIQASIDGEGETLARCVSEGLTGLLSSLCGKAGRHLTDIDGLVIAGNTAMLYLLTNTPPHALSKSPFQAGRLFDETVTAESLSLPVAPGAGVYLPRCLSAFVGADITAALLFDQTATGHESRALMDIGTNGEMALWHNGTLYACSTAAGPAFEGAGLSMGMNGETGAIDHMRVENGRLRAHVLGESAPRGVCGSGVIDAAACLLQTEQMDETGLLEEDPTLLSPPVSLSQKDIRMVQLAKSAICAGFLTLLQTVGLPLCGLSSLSVAGGFGSYLHLPSAGRIGLLPASVLPRVRVIGNASLYGASQLLLDTALRAKAAAMVKSAHLVPLHANPVFVSLYAENMLFPEEDG
ncbi:MAG TPA: DUF4445 domain-containing protein [Firmicutes bacterium]|nr:DUF4445 domain-containing protein [Bacillota bacterium]